MSVTPDQGENTKPASAGNPDQAWLKFAYLFNLINQQLIFDLIIGAGMRHIIIFTFNNCFSFNKSTSHTTYSTLCSVSYNLGGDNSLGEAVAELLCNLRPVSLGSDK